MKFLPLHFQVIVFISTLFSTKCYDNYFVCISLKFQIKKFFFFCDSVYWTKSNNISLQRESTYLYWYNLFKEIFYLHTLIFITRSRSTVRYYCWIMRESKRLLCCIKNNHINRLDTISSPNFLKQLIYSRSYHLLLKIHFTN